MVGRLGGAEKASCSHCNCGVVVRFACYFVGFQSLGLNCWDVETDCQLEGVGSCLWDGNVHDNLLK